MRVSRLRLRVLWLEWGLPTLLLVTVALAASSALAVGRPAVLPRALLVHAAAALVVGCVAYMGGAHRRQTGDGSVAGGDGALVQEATTHAPGGPRCWGCRRSGARRNAGSGGNGPAGPDATAAESRDRGGGRADGRGAAGRVCGTQAAETVTGIWFLCTIGPRAAGARGGMDRSARRALASFSRGPRSPEVSSQPTSFPSAPAAHSINRVTDSGASVPRHGASALHAPGPDPDPSGPRSAPTL